MIDYFLNFKRISFVEIEVFITIEDPKSTKIIFSQDCNFIENSEKTISIKIPKLHFLQEKSIFFVLNYIPENTTKSEKINLFHGNLVISHYKNLLTLVQAIACKLVGENSQINQILNFEKFMTNVFEISILSNLDASKIRYNENVYKRFYQIKSAVHIENILNIFGRK